MKRFFALLVATALLSSCNKDSDVMPVNGQYVADATDLTMAVIMDNGRCTRITVYAQGAYFGQWCCSSTSGNYPNYTYQVEDLTIAATYKEANSFSAAFSGLLKTNAGLMQGDVLNLDGAKVLFTLDNRQLDTDGDGLLDKR